jgi:hypothetical protein
MFQYGDKIQLLRHFNASGRSEIWKSKQKSKDIKRLGVSIPFYSGSQMGMNANTNKHFVTF